ncbi:MAG: hypothetical protein WDW38_010281 [Sanguina aurantia]
MVLHVTDRWYVSAPVSVEDIEARNAYALHAPLLEQPELYAQLPEAALHNVFEHLGKKSLAAVLLSCKRWREVARASAASISFSAYRVQFRRSDVPQECLEAAVRMFPRLAQLAFDFKGITLLAPLRQLTALTSLSTSSTTIQDILALNILHLPSLHTLTLYVDQTTHQEEPDPHSFLTSEQLFFLALFPPFKANILSLATDLVHSPLMAQLIPHVFPTLTSLDLRISQSTLPPAAWHRLFIDLPHLTQLAARTRKPRTPDPADDLVKSFPIEQQDETDALFLECESVQRLLGRRKAREDEESERALGAGSPAPPPVSTRIRSLRLGHVDMAAGLLPLGPYFPSLTRLEHLALVASDFTRAGPSAGSTSPRDVERTTSTAYGALPGSLWLSRFPALRELKVWLDPRDLPCIGGQHRLHIQAPFLRKLNLRLKPRPYPVVFSGSVPWLTEFEFGLNGRQRNTSTPIMLGLGKLLATSNASRIRLTSNSYDSRFSHIDAALRRNLLSNTSGSESSFTDEVLMCRLHIVTVVLELATQPSTFSALAPCLPNFFNLELKGQDPTLSPDPGGPASMEKGPAPGHDVWLQPAPPLVQPRLLRHLKGSLPWASTLRHLSLHSMHQLTGARLQQVVGSLQELETLEVSGGAPLLHCLRLHSSSLLDLSLDGLSHLLTWDMNCPNLCKVAIDRCSGWEISKYSDHPIAGVEPDPAFSKPTLLDVMTAFVARGIFEERWLEALLDGHPSLQLPSLLSVTLGNTSEDTLQADFDEWHGGEIPRLMIACKAGHPTLETLTVHNKLGIRQLVLQNLPALQKLEYTVSTALPQLRFVIVDPVLMAQEPAPELCFPASVHVMHNIPIAVVL